MSPLFYLIALLVELRDKMVMEEISVAEEKKSVDTVDKK